MSLIKTIKMRGLGDERGQLVVLEQDKTVPFEFKRVYYIYGTKVDVSRGFHAHRELEQIAICVTGKCRMILDDGEKREEIWLNNPQTGLLIEKMVWHEMHDFSSDCVLLVVANNYYDESDYIRNYLDFKKEAKLCQ